MLQNRGAGRKAAAHLQSNKALPLTSEGVFGPRRDASLWNFEKASERQQEKELGVPPLSSLGPTALPGRMQDVCIGPQWEQHVYDQIRPSPNEPREMTVDQQNVFPDSEYPPCPECTPGRQVSSVPGRGWEDVLVNDHRGTESPPGETGSNASAGDFGHYTVLSSQPEPKTAAASWIEESQQIVEIPTWERISASRQMKSVIKRTKESPNVHPMSRDLSPRRKFGPAIYNKSPSQDRLIEELHGRFGIEKQETYKSPEDNWLTEGVIITSRPSRNAWPSEQQIEKIIIPPDSLHLLGKPFSVPASLPGTGEGSRLVASKSTSPAQLLPPLAPPLPLSPAHLPPPHSPALTLLPPLGDYPCLSKSLPPCLEDPRPPASQIPSSTVSILPPSKSCVSIGCQTDDNPLFPPMQAGNLLDVD
ncbi:hypothetical protein FKM82_022661 [Ascaphus truei]